MAAPKLANVLCNRTLTTLKTCSRSFLNDGLAPSSRLHFSVPRLSSAAAPRVLPGHVLRAPRGPPSRALTGNSGPPSPGQPTPNPIDDAAPDFDEDERSRERGSSAHGWSQWKGTAFKMFESALTTAASISILGLVGYSYTRYYKYLVLEKMENAFRPGDPVLDLAASGKEAPSHADGDAGADQVDQRWIPRDEQAKIDAIVRGEDRGRYHLLIGEKGTGKSSMLIEAMAKVNGEGIAFFDAHADPEILRIRLGRALDFEFHEDNIGALFSIRGPRDASALLDIERAFNKLEKVALRRRKAVGRPLVIIINSTHLIRDNDHGTDMLELLQQRAEQWAASNLATIVFNSDKYWVYEKLKLHATRMDVTQVRDLPKDRALRALRNYRRKYWGERTPEPVLERVYDMIGGRLTFLNRVAKSRDMLQMCANINAMEKQWFLNNCGILGTDMDDDVMDQQKYASSAMVLALALHKRARHSNTSYDARPGHVLPEMPLHEARFTMTRADFIRPLHDIGIFAIDSHANVRAESVPMQRAFDEVCSAHGFEELLENTLERISDIESLGRTRELVLKDLRMGKIYSLPTFDNQGNQSGSTAVMVEDISNLKFLPKDGDEK